ncbi:hypothetical protein SAMN05421796_10939 [Chryseobacterium piscicola]|uniref:Uncharacterized protein n=1 Tax=Chryseobacterium piscicola TaxID=551459 RepID=A0A1N7NSP3_9FLAO|nr:hypothetical protein SAMN05421796_10939 [Chryseobacterium piscicola]
MHKQIGNSKYSGTKKNETANASLIIKIIILKNNEL